MCEKKGSSVILPLGLNPQRAEKPRMEHTPERLLLHPWPFRNQTQTHHGPVVVPVPSIPECLVPMVWDWQAWLAAETDGRASGARVMGLHTSRFVPLLAD